MTDLFLKVLDMSLAASVVILCVMAARLLLKKAPKIFSYALWAVVLFRLLCPVSLQAPVSLLEVTKPQVTQSEGITSTVSYVPAELKRVETTPVEIAAPGKTVEMVPEKKAVSGVTVAAWTWLAGIGVMALCSAVSYAQLRRRLAEAVPYRQKAWVADRIDSPFVLGILNPRIYLPSSTPEKERRFIIAHEEHHIRRGDHIVKFLAYAALCIHWINPLVWAAFLLAGKDMEMSCDEAVIKRLGEHIRADYSASLLRLATGRRIIAGTPLAFGEGDTKGRIMNMAKWKKPKVWVSILCVVICAVILIACGVNPEQEETVTADISTDPLEGCRQVVESVQNSDGYRILTERENFGGNVLNATSRIRDWKSGDTWLQINKVPEDGWMYYAAQIYRDGMFYDNWNIPGGRDENGHLLWAESLPSDRQKREPWLATFQWEDEKVELLSVEEIEADWQGTLTVVHLAVKDTLKMGDFETEEYTVDFTFDSEGEFYCAALSAEFPAEFPEDDYSLVNTMYIQTLDGTAVGKEIESYWKEGLSSLETGLQGNTVTYGDFSVTIPDGYSCRESQGAGLVLTKDGETVGGITHWNAPDFALESSNMSEWVSALGLLEAMGDEAYMIDGFSGSYLTAFYIDELDPIRLNVDHHFFTAGDLVYDIWFNNNVLSDADGSKFLKTVCIDGEPSALVKTDDAEMTEGSTVAVAMDITEEEAFERCRAVLDMVRSGSCRLAVENLTASDTHWSAKQFFQSGENWLQIIDIDPETVDIADGQEWSARIAYMYANGTRYSNEGLGGYAYTDINWAENGNFDDSMKPWLAGYQWNEDTVAFMGYLNDDAGECIMLRIDEHYAGREDYDPHYFVNFNFDTAGNFVNAKVTVNLYQENEFTDTESIVTLDDTTIAAEIEKEYNRAIS